MYSRGAILDAGTGTDRWSQLRAQKTTTQPTMWDTIRQARERKPGEHNQGDNGSIESDAERERRKAQEEFDALLERERKVGQDDSRELKSRWS
jgi:hypothetical protein